MNEKRDRELVMRTTISDGMFFVGLVGSSTTNERQNFESKRCSIIT